MSSKEHRQTAADLNKGYEENVVGLKGIIGFGIGLFLLIVVTFALMAALMNVLREYRKQDDAAANPLPGEMLMSDLERLPPEPRLQGAPGFGVDSEKGRVKMELGAPQDEYIELKHQWDELLEKGRRDTRTGAVIMLPIEEAMDKLVAQNPKAKAGHDAEEYSNHSKMFYSDASSGRMATLKRR